MYLFYTAVHMEASLLLGTPDSDAWVTHVRFAQSLALAWNKTLFQESKPTEKGKGTFRPPFGVLHVITSVIQREINCIASRWRLLPCLAHPGNSEMSPHTVTGFVLFWALQIPWLSMIFLWPFPVFQDLRFSCQFQKVKTFTCFRAFSDFNLNSSTDKLWRSEKCLPLLNYSSLSFIVLALSTAVNNLSNKTLIFYDFQGSRI